MSILRSRQLARLLFSCAGQASGFHAVEGGAMSALTRPPTASSAFNSICNAQRTALHGTSLLLPAPALHLPGIRAGVGGGRSAQQLRGLSLAAAAEEQLVVSERGDGTAQRSPRRSSTELRRIPGVGAKNEALLLSHHVDSLPTLHAVFQEHNGDESAMVRFLLEHVGIRNKRHCKSIVDYLAATSPPAARGGAARGGADLTLAVEGNISAGKSTFLRILGQEMFKLQEMVEVVPEPVASWQDVGESHINLLNLFYEAPERFAYTFQNYVFISRVVQEAESRGQCKPIRLLERSVFSDRMVFVRAVHEAKWLSDAELEIYDSWFNPVVRYLPGLVPQGFIYLRAEPETCHRRMYQRARSEESGVPLQYLASLHDKHDEWLTSGLTPGQMNSGYELSGYANSGISINGTAAATASAGQASATHTRPTNYFERNGVNALWKDEKLIIPPEPELIRGNVRFLKGPGVHPALHNLPALVLDCDQDIDVEQDADAKAHYAKQVEAYSEYVRNIVAWQREWQQPPGPTRSSVARVAASLVLPTGGGVRAGGRQMSHA